MLKCPRQLEIVPGASHLFPEPGALEEVARLAREWFLEYSDWIVREYLTRASAQAFATLDRRQGSGYRRSHRSFRVEETLNEGWARATPGDELAGGGRGFEGHAGRGADRGRRAARAASARLHRQHAAGRGRPPRRPRRWATA